MKRLAYLWVFLAPFMASAQDMVQVPRELLTDLLRRTQALESQVRYLQEKETASSGNTVSVGLPPSIEYNTTMQRIPDGEHGKAGFAAVSTSMWYHATNNYDAISLYKFGIGEYYDLTGKDVNMNAFDVLARTNSTAPHLVYLRGLPDVKVAVSSGATAGYLGRTYTNGVLWATNGIHYALADSDNAVLLSHEDLSSQPDIWGTGVVVINGIGLDDFGLGHVDNIGTIDLSKYFLQTNAEGELWVYNIVTNTDHGALEGLLDDDHPQYWITDGDSSRNRGSSIGSSGNTNVVIHLDNKTLIDNSLKTAIDWGLRELRGTGGSTVDAEWGQLGALDVQGDLYVSHAGAFFIGGGTAWTNTWSVGAGGDLVVNVPDQVSMNAGDDMALNAVNGATIDGGSSVTIRGAQATVYADSTDVLLEAGDDVQIKPTGDLEIWDGSSSYITGKDVDSGTMFKHGIFVENGYEKRKITVLDADGGTNITGYVLWSTTTLVP